MKNGSKADKKPKVAPTQAELTEAELQEVSGGARDAAVGPGGGPHVRVIDATD